MPNIQLNPRVARLPWAPRLAEAQLPVTNRSRLFARLPPDHVHRARPVRDDLSLLHELDAALSLELA